MRFKLVAAIIRTTEIILVPFAKETVRSFPKGRGENDAQVCVF